MSHATCHASLFSGANSVKSSPNASSLKDEEETPFNVHSLLAGEFFFAVARILRCGLWNCATVSCE